VDREEFERCVGDLLTGQAVMTLCTASDGQPWASDVYFAPLGYRLVFYSSPASRHMRSLLDNSACAATVHPTVSSWTDIHGLQMSGTVRALRNEDEAEQVAAAYLGKFPFARDLMSSPGAAPADARQDRLQRVVGHVFVPSYIRYLDNRMGFGAKFSMLLQDSAITGGVRDE